MHTSTVQPLLQRASFSGEAETLQIKILWFHTELSPWVGTLRQETCA